MFRKKGKNQIWLTQIFKNKNFVKKIKNLKKVVDFKK